MGEKHKPYYLAPHGIIKCIIQPAYRKAPKECTLPISTLDSTIRINELHMILTAISMSGDNPNVHILNILTCHLVAGTPGPSLGRK